MYVHYVEMFFGFILAQGLITSIMVYNYQKEKNIDYGAALTAYFKAEVGYFIIGIVGILCIIFFLSDFVDLSITRQDLITKGSLTWKENLQLYFKTASIFIGGFVQYIAFIYKKKGKDAIDKIAEKI